MKKAIVALLAATLVFSMAACGDSKSADKTETSAPQESSVNQGAESAPEEEEAEEEGTYEAGVWTDNVYTNASLGMTFTLPEGWEYGTAEDIEQVQSSGQEVTGLTDEELEATDVIYDIYIYNPTTGSSIMMMSEDLSDYGNITAEEYISSLSTQLQAYEDQGITYELGETQTKTLGATEFLLLDANAEYQGTSMYQCYGVTEKYGRMITIIASGAAGDGATECQGIIDSIQAVQ